LLPVFIRALRKTFRFSLADLSASTKGVNSNCKPLCLCSLPESHDSVRRSSRRSRRPCTSFGALAIAGRVLPDATPRGKAKISVSWRDRPNRCRLGALSEASAPGSAAPCRVRCAGRGADTPAIFARVGTFPARTAPAGRRPLAPRDGSDLLPLRLDSHGSWVTRFVVPPNREALRVLPMPARFPRLQSPFVPLRSAGRVFWRGSPAGNHGHVLVCAVAAITLWVTASAAGSKLSGRLTRLAHGF
jgi:hypothetical protein